jgi:hypothetical protein
VVAVAVNVSGLPPRPVAAAVDTFGPGVIPTIQELRAAIPLALVVTGVVGFTIPPPEVTANVTDTLATGLPAPSLTITAGGELTALPTVADWLAGLFAAIVAGGPAASTIAPDVAGVSPPAPKLSV